MNSLLHQFVNELKHETEKKIRWNNDIVFSFAKYFWFNLIYIWSENRYIIIILKIASLKNNNKNRNKNHLQINLLNNEELVVVHELQQTVYKITITRKIAWNRGNLLLV